MLCNQSTMWVVPFCDMRGGGGEGGEEGGGGKERRVDARLLSVVGLDGHLLISRKRKSIHIW